MCFTLIYFVQLRSVQGHNQHLRDEILTHQQNQTVSKLIFFYSNDTPSHIAIDCQFRKWERFCNKKIKNEEWLKQLCNKCK